MDFRRFTMTNPTVLFSSIAHEAWGHKITDEEEEDENDEHQIDEHNASIRARRRFR
ncbi:unnamed protein product, partial [Adineta steineri]